MKLWNVVNSNRDYGLRGAVEATLLYRDDLDGRMETLAAILAALMEKLPPDQVIHILNAPNCQQWEKD